MWSSRALRGGLVALALLGGASLSACSSFTPVYGEAGIGVAQHEFRYAKPSSRLEQIIYQELVLRLGRSSDPAAPTVRITTSSAARDLTKSSVLRPSEHHAVTVSALIEIVSAEGVVVYSASRSATASYTIDRQALAQAEAEQQAREQAARALAETVRLTLIGALAQPAT